MGELREIGKGNNTVCEEMKGGGIKKLTMYIGEGGKSWLPL